MIAVKGLVVSFSDPAPKSKISTLPQGEGKNAVDGVDFELLAGKITALIGESGSGKSSIGLALLGLVRGGVVSGCVDFAGRDLLKNNEKDWQKLRGNDIAMLFQDPNSAFNPLHRVGDQILEAILIHNPDFGKKKALTRVNELLDLVGLAALKQRMRDFPHQFSGGQKQRLMLAMALANSPKVLILDEPTTALDPESKKAILQLILHLKKELGLTILLITHDLQAAKEVGDTIILLKNGKIIEKSPNFFKEAKSQYGQKLLEIYQKSQNFSKKVKKLPKNAKNLLEIDNLSLKYVKSGFFAGKSDDFVLKDVDFSVKEGENLGIIGKSGAGKSSLGKALLGLVDFDGEIHFAYENSAQIVFQDPFSSLNPRFKVSEIVLEGLKIMGEAVCGSVIDEIFADLGLDLALKNRYPHQLSGGQRQRVALARALVMKPRLLILDEPTSALDFISQEQLLLVLEGLSRENKMSLVTISHDMAVVRRLSDRILCLEGGWLG